MQHFTSQESFLIKCQWWKPPSPQLVPLRLKIDNDIASTEQVGGETPPTPSHLQKSLNSRFFSKNVGTNFGWEKIIAPGEKNKYLYKFTRLYGKKHRHNTDRSWSIDTPLEKKTPGMQNDFPFGQRTDFQLPTAPPLGCFLQRDISDLRKARHWHHWHIGITWIHMVHLQISHFRIFQLSKYHEYCILFHPNAWSQYSWFFSLV